MANIHDLAKKLQREPLPSRPLALPPTTSPKPLKTRAATTPWLFVQALHQGQTQTVEALLAQSELIPAEKTLLQGMKLAWQETAPKAEKLLHEAATSLAGVGKCWAHWQLAELYLMVGNDELVDHHISRARRYAYDDRRDEQCLLLMVDLLDARTDIERGAHDRAQRTLRGLLEDCQDPYLRGYVHYLWGCLGRFRTDLPLARQEALEIAQEVFTHTEPDRYWRALTRAELSRALPAGAPALELLTTAIAELQHLGRQREVQIWEAWKQELTAQITPPQTAGTKAATANMAANADYERVGQCLFISASMRAIRLRLGAIAGAEQDPVLILGPRGCGKELMAQSIHLLSPRHEKPFLAVNCAALPDQLIESELFGYEKGAFTGAQTAKPGMFELSQGGTLFLDEIGELSTLAQTKLLRVLQTGAFRRLGGTRELHTTARIITATNRDLAAMCQEGRFRDDLLDRIAVWRLRIPPLSRRREEILPLAMEFLRRYGEGKYQLDKHAERYLLEKDYPGNVRILENDIRRSIGNARAANTTTITPEMIYEDFTFAEEEELRRVSKDGKLVRPTVSSIPNYDEAMLNFERDLLIKALAACQWNKKMAARVLGMTDRTFWRAVQRHRLYTRPDDVE
jgi:DNA-binding NtrC family response regulator